MQKISKPLPLSGAKNIRDLGGYRTESGLITKSHSFLRGDALHNLSDEDCRLLYDYGVRCVIDLRSFDEIARESDRLPLLYKETGYVHIPIQDHIRSNRYSEEFPPSMWELYCWLLDDSRAEFYSVFDTMVKYPDSCVLFHCSGGKDRTGMTAMLLLKLAGVDDATIIGDYAYSEKAMADIFPLQAAQMEARGLVVPPYVMQSPPENMERALNHLYSVYHSAEDYLKLIGVSKEQVEIIKKKLIRQRNE